jgi:hypothetical protein
MDYNRRPRRDYQYENYQRNRIERTNRNINRFFESNFGSKRRRDNYDYIDRRPRRNYNNYRENRRRDEYEVRRQPQRQFDRGLRIGNRRNDRLRRGIRRDEGQRRGLRLDRNEQGQRRGMRRNEKRIGFRNGRREERRIFGRKRLPIGKILVSNLPAEAINDDLITIFGAYGRLKRCAVIFENNESTRTGVVQYFSKACTERAVHDLNGTFVKGNNIHLQLEDTRKSNNKQGQQVVVPQQQADYVMSGQ